MFGRTPRRVMSLALAAAIAPAIAFASGAQAKPSGPTPPSGYNAAINQGNVPTTAKAFSQDCNSDEFANKPADSDGWLFVASPSNFQKLQAQFNDGANVVNFSGTDSATAYYTKVGDHVAVITPGGWTLTQAFAQLDGDRDFFVLSHTCAATSSQPQPQNTPPSASRGDTSCSSVTFNLSAGSQDTTFQVTPTNGSTTDVPVAANQTKPYTVQLDSAHPGASVTADGSPLASYTRPDSCNESTPGGGDQNNSGGGDNNGSGNDNSNVGGSSNSGSSNSGNGGVGSGPSGPVATGGVGTGGVTTGSTSSGGAVSSSGGLRGGGGPTSAVLGEKITKKPGAAGSGASSAGASVAAAGAAAGGLPFTGFAARHAVQIAALLMLLGFAALATGRRRAPAHQYIQVRN